MGRLMDVAVELLVVVMGGMRVVGSGGKGRDAGGPRHCPQKESTS